MVFKKPNFGPKPDNYVAGLGRGAGGFVTRADYGPSKIGGAAVGGQPVEGSGGPGVKQAPTAALRELTSLGKQPQAENQDYSDANFDEWGGYSGSLFSGQSADIEDRDADNTFSNIDEYMDGRR